MAWSETPIFPGKPKNDLTAVAASSVSNYTIFDPGGTYGGLVKALNVYAKGSGGAVTVRLEVVESATAYTLWRGTVGASQYSNANLLTSDKLAWINDADPALHLEPGQTLRLAVENSVANELDVVATGATYEYPN